MVEEVSVLDKAGYHLDCTNKIENPLLTDLVLYISTLINLVNPDWHLVEIRFCFREVTLQLGLPKKTFI